MFRYVGPCRCGFGPHAYYEDVKGRIYHVSEICPYYSMGYGKGGFKPEYAGYPYYLRYRKDERELEILKEEKEWIERRIKELEKKIKEKG